MRKPQVYGYVRLSRDDDDVREGVEGQKAILTHAAKKMGYELIDIFEDCNYSGMNFNRPSIIKIEKMINNGNIDILMVKDISRIGRHVAQTLTFVENMGVRGVRLIAVSDNFDSFNEQSKKNLGITAFINEMYAQDISNKVLSKLRNKQETTGLLIKVPYGFIRTKVGRDTLLTVDEEARVVVDLIYKLYLGGFGMKKISLKLNELRYDTPSIRQFKTMGTGQREGYIHAHIWYETSIRRILTNPCYIGTLVNRKTTLSKVKGKKVMLPESEHIEHQDFFPPIIGDETYYGVQQMMKVRRDSDTRASSNTNQPIYRYSSILKCGECKKGFITRKYPSGKISYECSTHKRYGKKECNPHRIDEVDIDEVVIKKMKVGFDNAKNNLALFDNEIDKMKNEKNSYDGAISKITTELLDFKEERKNYNRMLAKGQIDELEYNDFIQEVDNSIKICAKQLEDLKESRIINNVIVEGGVNTISIIEEIVRVNAIEQKYIQTLIKNIYIYDTFIPTKFNRTLIKIEIVWQDLISVLFANIEEDENNLNSGT